MLVVERDDNCSTNNISLFFLTNLSCCMIIRSSSSIECKNQPNRSHRLISICIRQRSVGSMFKANISQNIGHILMHQWGSGNLKCSHVAMMSTQAFRFAAGSIPAWCILCNIRVYFSRYFSVLSPGSNYRTFLGVSNTIRARYDVSLTDL